MLRGTKPPKPHRLREIIRQAGDRANLVVGQEEIGLFEVLYTDFTEIYYADGTQKAQLMPILDHASWMCLGWAVGERANRSLALRAWKRAGDLLERSGVERRGMIMHHDQDSVYTSCAWTG